MEQTKNEDFYLSTAPVKKLLYKFSIPCVLAMLVGALYNIVDQIFLGNSTAGQAGIMATTLVFPFTVVALAFAQLFGDGCAALYSILLGEKKIDNAKKCVGNGLVVSVFASIVLMVLGFALLRPILGLLGANGYDPVTQEYTRTYLTIILAGLPFYMITNTAASIIRADGAPKFSMIATVSGAIVNIILDPILILGCNMGVQGAAIATIAGQVISGIISIMYFKKMKMISLTYSDFKPDMKVILGISRLGISSFITQIAIAIITIVANNVVGAIGGNNATDAGAALGIVFKVFAIILAFSLGIAVGGQPIIGYNYGSKRYDRVVETIKHIVIANIVIGLIATILFEFAPSILVSLFGNGSEFYKQYAVLSFRIYLGGMLFCCLQKSSCVILQSINKPYKAMTLSLMRDVILLVPGVCLLGLLGNLNTMLWAGIIADVGAFIPTAIFLIIEVSKLNKQSQNAVATSASTKAQSMPNYAISISREYGSGGKYVAEQLASKLGIKCYDSQILAKLAESSNIDVETLKNFDEKSESKNLYSFASTFNLDGKAWSADDNLFLMQSKIIEDLVRENSCVIVGRCSDVVLGKYENVVKIFVYSSDFDFKVTRKMEYDKLTHDEAVERIKKTDKMRANYYKRYTGKEWGDRVNYDILVDTSVMGVDKTVEYLIDYVSKRVKK